MLFYKPLFSFVVAFAAASRVIASPIPVAGSRGNDNDNGNGNGNGNND